MRKLALAALMLLTIAAYAQDPAENPGALPSIIPPSPEISSLNRIGSVSTSLHTGAASVSIPLYDLKVGTISHPISLAYSTNGIRVNDIPSRVGLGWNLVAGGTVNRTIHDEEDDGPYTTRLTTVPDFVTPDASTLDYLQHAVIEGYDTEDDEYSYAVGGLSGKFYFDASGDIQCIDQNNLKMTRSGDIFTITTGEGVVYTFGGTVKEKTSDVKTNGNQRTHPETTTGWFLTDIVSPEGDTIHFIYSTISIVSQMGPYQSAILQPTTPGYPGGVPMGSNCGGLCSPNWGGVGYSKISYDTYYLSGITTSDGREITFDYSARPDISGDKRLTGLTVSADYPTVHTIKAYSFEYTDYTVASNTTNQRFFLHKLNELATDGSGKKISHEFEYNDPSTLGKQEALTQDYYGYSRADGNPSEAISGNFIPRPDNYADLVDGYDCVDRSPVFSYAKAGALTKVIYPTGGYEQFEYEPHVIGVPYTTYDTTYSTMSVEGRALSSAENPSSSEVVYSQNLTITAAHMKVYFLTNPYPGGTWTPDGIHYAGRAQIIDLSTNSIVYDEEHHYFEGSLTYLDLSPGNYEVRVRLNNYAYGSWGKVTVSYDPVVTTINGINNVTGCGIRVKKIRAFDPLTQKAMVRFYTYGSMAHPEVSSGVGLVKPSFGASYRSGGICNSPDFLGDVIFTCPEGMVQLSSSALSDNFTFSGSPVAYAYVLESDDSTFVHGATEHKFYTAVLSDETYTNMGTQIAGTSARALHPDHNGEELQTTVYKNDEGVMVPLTRQVHVFTNDNSRTVPLLTNYVIRKRWNPPTGTFSYSDKCQGFDVNSYSFISGWISPLRDTTFTYDENGSNPKIEITEYAFANNIHQQPTAITTTNSRGETIVKAMKYPAEMTGTVYSDMVNDHVITPLIEMTTTNNSNTVSQVRTNYAAIASGPYKPESVEIKNGSGPLEERLRYYAYDDYANPLEVAKDNGAHVAYLWNYQHTYPVAEVKNAKGTIAYTSFEGDDNGNWVREEKGEIVEGGITGDYSYSGTITAVAPSGAPDFTVTVWSNDAVLDADLYPKCNSLPGTAIAHHQGWTLYRWQFDDFSGTDIAIKGGQIDEARLYATESQMTTYTYRPYIGVSDICDANSNIQYNSYDNFGRLSEIQDVDRNIVKKICYQYAGDIASCDAGIFYNTEQSGTFTKSCDEGYTGSTVTYTVAANTYSSTVSQAAADALAAADVSANGQAYANANGTCIAVCTSCTGDNKKCIDGVCETGVTALISSVYVSGRGGGWTCTYKYCFSDGSYSTYSWSTTGNASSCIGPLCLY